MWTRAARVIGSILCLAAALPGSVSSGKAASATLAAKANQFEEEPEK